ncbi:NUDIX domain-containing protein [Thaumasiovibrio sp. DFM-14]|uniref:NUDIX domain-containing protein n=1 Tax=Thaumasiovibrio sp. DFM-14 TaxID=3384792 RepID=UPI0039A3EF0A
MKHRIRAAGILEEAGKLLLLRVEDHTGQYWTPPGGGMEAHDQGTRDTVKREFFEETGLTVEVGAFLFARELLETSKSRYHAEFFYRIASWQGEITQQYLKGLNDESYIKEAAWLSQHELQALRVYPKEIKHEIWDILRENRYSLHLGRFIEESPL